MGILFTQREMSFRNLKKGFLKSNLNLNFFMFYDNTYQNKHFVHLRNNEIILFIKGNYHRNEKQMYSSQYLKKDIENIINALNHAKSFILHSDQKIISTYGWRNMRINEEYKSEYLYYIF
jgi:hypothetical protein